MEPPGYLLDANVFIALVIKDHAHHNVAMNWYRRHRPAAYLCPIVEGALIRLLVRRGHGAAEGQTVLRRFYDNDRHAFVADALSYMDTDISGVIGHQQVTDAYLAALARTLNVKLATFDAGLQEAHHDVAVSIPT